MSTIAPAPAQTGTLTEFLVIDRQMRCAVRLMGLLGIAESAVPEPQSADDDQRDCRNPSRVHRLDSSTLKDTDHDDDERHEQQNVDESAKRVRRYQPEGPQDQQDHHYSFEHFRFLLLVGTRLGASPDRFGTPAHTGSSISATASTRQCVPVALSIATTTTGVAIARA